MLPLLRLAAQVAKQHSKNDKRIFLLGAVGVRKDGVLVSAKNGAVHISGGNDKGVSYPPAHAEARLLRKMDRDGIVYVARVARIDGKLAMARPCMDCMTLLRMRKVRTVYYTISETEYGVIDLGKRDERIYS